MKILWLLAWKSLRNRKLTAILSVLSMGLSVALLIGVERVRLGARYTFNNTISQTDLVVGARSSPLQMILYSVFYMGSATNNIRWSTYKHFQKHPMVEWSIPLSLGDSHRGYRVLATDENFYRHYRFRDDHALELDQGSTPSLVTDVVLGAEVAEKLGYKVGNPLVLTHGLGGFYQHEDKPFRVVGVLKRTLTPIDRILIITLPGMEAIHSAWQADASNASLANSNLNPKQLTAFLVRAKSRISILHLQRDLNTFEEEAIMGAIPGVELANMWNSMGYVENTLRVISFFVIFVSSLGMLMALYTTLKERRREMAILRSLGSHSSTIFGLFVLESALLSLGGMIFGVLLCYLCLWGLQPLLEQQFGLFVPILGLQKSDFLFLGIVFVAGLMIGLIPAWKAYRQSLSDGLSVRL